MSDKKNKMLASIIFTALKYILLPVLSGFLTVGVLAIAGLEKLGLDRVSVGNVPTIAIGGVTYTTYLGLMISVGIGCVIGLILLRLLWLGVKLIKVDLSDPSESVDAIPIPSVMGFIKSLVHLVGLPLLVALVSYTVLKIAETELLLPFVVLDMKYRSFELSMDGIVIVAALGCLIIFICDIILTRLLKTIRHKDVKLEEVR